MKCSICDNDIPVKDGGWSEGNNAQPVSDGRCCDDCNTNVVIPARLQLAIWTQRKREEEEEQEQEHWLYLLSHNGYCRVVGEEDNWSTAHQMTGDTGRLFASAPALLAALKGMVQRAEGQLWSDHWLADARAVLAKVEGTSNG